MYTQKQSQPTRKNRRLYPRAKGRLKIEATQMDLPPSITQIPAGDYFKLKENKKVAFDFHAPDLAQRHLAHVECLRHYICIECFRARFWRKRFGY